MQIDLAAPRACQAEPQGNAEAPDPTAVLTWSEEKLLELATSLPAMRAIRHQPRSPRQSTSFMLKKLLQHHTHCPNGSSDVILNPSRLSSLQPDGLGWVPGCWCGPVRAVSTRTTMD